MDFAEPRYVGWGERHEEPNGTGRDGDPEHAAGRRQQTVFREQLPDDPGARPAERRTHGHLPHARDAAYGEKVGDIDARNQKQQARGGGEGEQRGADVTDHQSWPRGRDAMQVILPDRRAGALQEGGQLVSGTRR
jgi:hypothetical protein